MSAHTPGPWFVEDPPHEDRERNISDSAGDKSRLKQYVGTAWGGGYLDAQVDANARLIAAAPDLLASLTELVNSPNVKQNNAWDRARAAIAKAEGR